MCPSQSEQLQMLSDAVYMNAGPVVSSSLLGQQGQDEGVLIVQQAGIVAQMPMQAAALLLVCLPASPLASTPCSVLSSVRCSQSNQISCSIRLVCTNMHVTWEQASRQSTGNMQLNQALL